MSDRGNKPTDVIIPEILDAILKEQQKTNILLIKLKQKNNYTFISRIRDQLIKYFS